MAGKQLRLLKAITAGTTVLIHPGPGVPGEVAGQILDPVRGIGADLLITLEGTLRAYTSRSEIAPPAAALRAAAAFHHSRSGTSPWLLRTPRGESAVELIAEEYALPGRTYALVGGSAAQAAGHDITVDFTGLSDPRPGLRVGVGPSTVAVVPVASPQDLGGIDLLTPPQTSDEVDLVVAAVIMGQRSVDLTDPSGRVVGSQEVGAVQVRGFERAIGELFSADTIAVASAVAAGVWAGQGSAREWVVVFGGGTSRVDLGEVAVVSATAEIFAEIDWRP